MSSNASSPRHKPPSPADALESISRLFANAWQAGEAPAIREFAHLIPDSLAIEDRRHALFTLVMIDLEQRWSSKGLTETSRAAASTHGPHTEAPAVKTLTSRPLVEDYLALFPELGPFESIPVELAELERSLRASRECSPTIDFNKTVHHDGQTVRLAAKKRPPDGSSPTHDFPAVIGRYKISSVLGAGGFGTVYLGYDGDLERKVAIKVPIGFDADGGAAEHFLAEARHAAKLRHPGIVAVYDVGVEPSGLPFIVMEYVDGVTLENLLRRQRLGREEAIDVMIRIGEAVHFAHQKGLVHRDLKPGNILMEQDRSPRVVDFGLAVVEEEQMEQAGRVAGTPYYMSPELSRGETHRLDGRSDLWSLGVIFYELLTGVRPFGRVSTSRLHDEIQHRDPKPPRQFDDTIAKPLEFACLKCLSKRVSDRYATVADFVQDLRDAARSPTGSHDSVARRLADQPSPGARTGVIPKGLRSFGAMDADFFLTLLPGPRDRNGLPEPIRFWKNCLENRRPESASPLCVLYGPSGCGKSSLMKAGVLPRLSAEVTPVFVEATQVDTEQRLSRALAHTQLQGADNDDLPRTICRIRQKLEAQGGPKLLIVVDQFEQWLHQGKTGDDSELVRGLRQCDGVNVQCLLLVRDDFWMGVTRVAHEVEMRLIDGENCAPVDLFDRNHAKKVLTMFGQAYSQLPELEEDLSDAHHKFVEGAVASIEDKGYVSPVLLSLFADMMKGRPWDPDTLRTLGGAQGVAEAFLEETFCSRSAPLGRRRHEASARRVLAAMLPVDQAEIRGPMIPVESMRIAAGYDSGSDDFASLLQILDSELRLISPCDPEGAMSPNPTHAVDAGQQYFQLTHDVLVPALRRWLTRRLRETRRGRAQLILEERTEQWSTARDKRYLPTAGEWGKIVLFSRKSSWTESQKSTMRHSTRRHLLRAAAYLSAAALLAAAYLYSRPSQLEVFANVKLGHARRAAALGFLDLNQPEQIAQVCETLADDPDAQLVIDGLRAMSARGLSGLGNRSKSAAEAANVRGLCKQLITSNHDLDDRQSSPEQVQWDKVQLEALDTYGEFATPEQFWELAIDVEDRPVAKRVVRAVVDKARATDWQTLSPAESHSLQAMLVDRLPRQSSRELAAAGISLLRQLRDLADEPVQAPTPHFFRWLIRSGVMQEGSEVCAAAVSYLDSLTPAELTRTVVATAQEDNDITVAAELWLAPYAKLAAPKRIDELGDWSERRFLRNATPADDASGEISLSPTAIYDVQAVAMLSQHSSKRRDAVYRRAYSLLRDWQALDAIDAFEPIARAIELLHAKGESSQRDGSIRESLTAAIAHSESPFTRAAAVRTLESLDGSNEATVNLIAKIAADDGEPFIVREACLRSLTSLADDDFTKPAAQAIQQLFLELAQGDPSQRIRSMAIVSYGRVADLAGIEHLKPLLIDQGLNPAASTALWSILQRHPDQAGDGIAAVAEFLALEYPKHEAKLALPATMLLQAIAVRYTDDASTLAFQNIVARLGELAKSEPNEAVRAFCRDAQAKLEVVLQGNKAHAPPDTSAEPSRSQISPAE